MASLISQMRNGLSSSSPLLPQQNNILQTKQLMEQLKNIQNPNAILANIINQNPMLRMAFKNGNLEQTARAMAQAQGIDINQLIKQLQGGI